MVEGSLAMSSSENGTPETAKPTLAQKILDIQKSVGVVKKKGFNKEHNYKFLQIEDAVLAVNKLLASHELLLIPTLQKQPDGRFYWETVPHTGGKGYIAKAVFEWKLEDVLTSESRLYDIPGEGYDTTDKGTAKAITASRKQAIIVIFQLAVGFDNEAQSPSADREDAKAKAKALGEQKVAELSQVEPERKVLISRPEEHSGNYIIVTGMIAVPQLERFFDDTASKRFKTKTDLVPYWRVPSGYEKDLVTLCQRLNIEVEG